MKEVCKTIFEEGDVVQLKSGGPIMTVTYVKGDTVAVSWFNCYDDGFHNNSEIRDTQLIHKALKEVK